MNFMMVVKGEEGGLFHASPLYPFYDWVGCATRCVVHHPRRHTNPTSSYWCHVEFGERGWGRSRSSQPHASVVREGECRPPPQADWGFTASLSTRVSG